MDIRTLTKLQELRAGHADINEYGTDISGFVCGHEGPFNCGHCSHYSDDACNHPMVMADPKVKKNDHGDAIVDGDDCCKYWWPIGKK